MQVPVRDALLTQGEVAKWLGVSPHTLVDWRRKGRGPVFVRLTEGGGVRYRPEEVERFLAEREQGRPA